MKSLREVPDLSGDAVASPYSECVSPSRNISDKSNITGEKLFFGKREVPAKGSVLITTASSPSGRNVAILSADGPRMRSRMPLWESVLPPDRENRKNGLDRNYDGPVKIL